MLKGFKQFLLRGNVIDLAVAVVIGGAFGAQQTRHFLNVSTASIRIQPRGEMASRVRKERVVDERNGRGRALDVEEHGFDVLA